MNLLRELLKRIIKPVHRHPQMHWWEWESFRKNPDAFHRPFEYGEEGVWKRARLSTESVTANGLSIDFYADGLMKVVVS